MPPDFMLIAGNNDDYWVVPVERELEMLRWLSREALLILGAKDVPEPGKRPDGVSHVADLAALVFTGPRLRSLS